MIRSLLAIGAFGAAGVLSICDLCKPAPAYPEAGSDAAVHATPASGQTAGATTPVIDPKTAAFRVEGMTCGGCVVAVRKVLSRLDGVTKAEVSYETRRAVVSYDPAKVTIEQMIAAISTLGYRATLIVDDAKPGGARDSSASGPPNQKVVPMVTNSWRGTPAWSVCRSGAAPTEKPPVPTVLI